MSTISICPLPPLSPMDKVVTASALAHESPNDTTRPANFMLSRYFRLYTYGATTPVNSVCSMAAAVLGERWGPKSTMRSSEWEVEKCGMGFGPVWPFNGGLGTQHISLLFLFSGGSASVVFVPAWSFFFFFYWKRLLVRYIFFVSSGTIIIL